MGITKNRYLISLISLCLILLIGCSSKADPQQNEEIGPETDIQQDGNFETEIDSRKDEEFETEINLYEDEELSEWEKLYDQWQENELETELSFGKEIYSVSVVRRCGIDEEDIFMTYNFSLYDTDREDVLNLLTKEEHIITNNVLKAESGNSVTFYISDDSGCIKEIGFSAEADEDVPVYFRVAYLFPYKDKGDVRMSFAGELAYEEWTGLMEIVNKNIAERPFDEINI